MKGVQIWFDEWKDGVRAKDGVMIEFGGSWFLGYRDYSCALPEEGYCGSQVGFTEEGVGNWSQLSGTGLQHPCWDAFGSWGLGWVTPAELVADFLPNDSSSRGKTHWDLLGGEPAVL